MCTIISGFFQTQDEVEFAFSELQRVGFALPAISTFYVNPAGQHDLHQVGGDQDKSKGAKDDDDEVIKDVTAGGVAGVVVGATTIPVTGPLGPLLGALVGGGVGAVVSAMHSHKEQEEQNRQPPGGAPTGLVRKAGMLVAVAAESPEEEDLALALLHSIKAEAIERSSGTIVDGDWIDFDPLSVPHLVTRVGPPI